VCRCEISDEYGVVRGVEMKNVMSDGDLMCVHVKNVMSDGGLMCVHVKNVMDDGVLR